MLKIGQDHFQAILSIFDFFAHIEMASPCQVTRGGGGVTQYSEIQPGSFSGHFEHFSFFGHIELPPAPPPPVTEQGWLANSIWKFSKNFEMAKKSSA